MGFVGDVIEGLIPGLGPDPEAQQEKALKQQQEMSRLAAELARGFEQQAKPVRELAFRQLTPFLRRGPQPAPDLSGLRDTANPFRSQFSVDLNTAPLPETGGGQAGPSVPEGFDLDLDDIRQRVQDRINRQLGGGAPLVDPRGGPGPMRDPRGGGGPSRQAMLPGGAAGLEGLAGALERGRRQPRMMPGGRR